MKKYLDDVRALIKSRRYILPLLAIALISYGYAVFNTSVSMDDTEADRYVGSGNHMLGAGRFGIWFWSFIEGRWENSYLTDIIAIFLIIFACTNFCVLFKRISNGKIGLGALTIFSCIFISQPIMSEIWELTGANVNIGAALVFVSFSLLIIYSFIHSEKRNKDYLSLLGIAPMMTLVCAGYESVVPIYIFFVFAILALQIIYGEEKEKKFLEILKQGLIYASFLVIGIVLRIVVHKLILILFDIPLVQNGATDILWGTMPATQIIKSLMVSIGFYWIFGALISPPLTSLVLSGVALIIMGLVASKKHSPLILLMGAGMFLSLIILPVIQGSPALFRTCQVFAAFCGFTAMMFVTSFPKGISKRKNILRVCAITLCGFFAFYQASFINYFLELNHRRSENEIAIIRQVSYDLKSEFDITKPVIFVGGHKLSDSIIEAASIPEDSKSWILYTKCYAAVCEITGQEYDISSLKRKLVQSNIKPLIDWGFTSYWSPATYSTQEAMPKIFSYFGCDYIPADFDTYFDVATEYAEEENMPAYPEKGYIKDMGDYIIVHMQ